MFDYSVNFTAIDNISAKIDKINAKIAGLKQKASQASKNLNFVGNVKLKTKEAFAKLRSLKDKMRDIGVKALAIGGAGIFGIKKAVDAYQEVARAKGEIVSLGINKSGIEGITKEAIRFSNEWAGITQADFIKSSYDIKSGIASLSDAGVAKMTRYANLTAMATKASGEEMSKLFAMGYGIFRKSFKSDMDFGQKFSASIAQAVQAFRTDGNDLVQGFGALGSVAVGFGIKYAEQIAILGETKGAFKSASEGATSYKGFLKGVGKAQKALNLNFTDKITGRMLPMADILDKIKSKYKDIKSVKAQVELQKAFGSEEATKIINALINKTGQLRKSIKGIEGAMSGGMKLTIDMAKALQQGTEFELLGNRTENMMISIGRIFAPIALQIGGIFGRWALYIQSFTKEHPKLAKAIGIVITALSALAIAVGVIAIGSVMLTPLIGAMGVLAGAVGLLFSPITLVVGALVGLYVYWDEIVKLVTPFSNLVIQGFVNMGEWIMYGIQKLKEWWSSWSVGSVIDDTKMLISNFFTSIGKWATSFNFINGAVELFKGLIAPIKTAIEWISKLLDKIDVVNRVKSKLSGITDSITEGAKSLYDTVTSYISGDDKNKKDATRDKANSLSETNINKNRAMQSLDIMVRAEEGTSGVAHYKENGNTKKIRNISNRTAKVY